MKEINLYCKKCRNSFGTSYTLSGNPDSEIFTGIKIKCHTCKRVLVFKKYTEKMIVDKSYSNGKIYI